MEAQPPHRRATKLEISRKVDEDGAFKGISAKNLTTNVIDYYCKIAKDGSVIVYREGPNGTEMATCDACVLDRGQSHIFLAGHEHSDIELRHSSVGFMFSRHEITSVLLHNPPPLADGAVPPDFQWEANELRDMATGGTFVARFHSERNGEKLGRLEVTGEQIYETYMDTIVLTELILLEREEYGIARHKSSHCIIA